MTVLNIAVDGLGTFGTQIAIQVAAYGHRVCGFDSDRTAFQRVQTKAPGHRRR